MRSATEAVSRISSRVAPSWMAAAVRPAMQHSALAFESLAPLLLCVRRLRPVAYVWGIGFHLMIGLTMHMLILFSLQMICFYVLFVDARRLRRVEAGLRRVFRA